MRIVITTPNGKPKNTKHHQTCQATNQDQENNEPASTSRELTHLSCATRPMGSQRKGTRRSNSNARLPAQDIEEDSGAFVWETLTFLESVFWKIDQFLAATDQLTEGEDVSLDASDCVGREGVFELMEDKDRPDRNRIARFVVDSEGEDGEDSDIPF